MEWVRIWDLGVFGCPTRPTGAAEPTAEKFASGGACMALAESGRVWRTYASDMIVAISNVHIFLLLVPLISAFIYIHPVMRLVSIWSWPGQEEQTGDYISKWGFTSLRWAFCHFYLVIAFQQSSHSLAPSSFYSHFSSPNSLAKSPQHRHRGQQSHSSASH